MWLYDCIINGAALLTVCVCVDRRCCRLKNRSVENCWMNQSLWTSVTATTTWDCQYMTFTRSGRANYSPNTRWRQQQKSPINTDEYIFRQDLNMSGEGEDLCNLVSEIEKSVETLTESVVYDEGPERALTWN